MTLDPALPPEGLRHDINPEMRLSTGAVPGVAFMLVGFINDAQALRRESLRQLLRDDVGGAHRFRFGRGRVARYQKDAVTGHRPTWRMGFNGGLDGFHANGSSDPFEVLRELGTGSRARVERPAPERRTIRNAERKAFDTLGLEVDAAASEIKARFKELVKRHHPDANGGDRSLEDRLREIIQAYNYLKSAKFC